MSANTIWLASYPKSGNTWVRALLTGLEHDDELDINRLGQGPIASAREPMRAWLGIPTSDLTPVEVARVRLRFDAELDATLEQVRFRKIHDGLFTGPDDEPIVPPGATRGAVYIVRDPRAVAVSFAHHLGVSVERSVEIMAHSPGPYASEHINGIQLPQRMETWSDHVRGWCDHELFPVLVVRYEDLHTDPIAELSRIVEFAGLSASAESIGHAVTQAGFARLQAKEQSDGFREQSGRGRFFRRGEAEAWREELDEELVVAIERDHGETMLRLGYEMVAARA